MAKIKPCKNNPLYSIYHIALCDYKRDLLWTLGYNLTNALHNYHRSREIILTKTVNFQSKNKTGSQYWVLKRDNPFNCLIIQSNDNNTTCNFHL